MRSTTLVGALLGGAALLAGGVALARKGAGAVPADPFFVYVVQPGDSLSDLAFRFFGDAKKWPKIAEANAALLPSGNDVPAGAKVRIPCVWVTVQKDDTLATIAKRVLGDGARWRRIMEANRNASAKRLADPDKLAVGQVLAVPLEPGQKDRPAPSSPGPRAPVAPPLSVGAELELLDAELVGCP